MAVLEKCTPSLFHEAFSLAKIYGRSTLSHVSASFYGDKLAIVETRDKIEVEPRIIVTNLRL